MLTIPKRLLSPQGFRFLSRPNVQWRPLDTPHEKNSPPLESPPPPSPPLYLKDVVVSNSETFRYILKHLWPQSASGRFQTIGSLGLIALGKTAQGRTPALMGRLLDLLSDSKLLSEGDSEDWSSIMRCAGMIAGYRAVSIFTREMRGALYTRAINSANRQMASELYTVLQNAHMDFLLRNPPGELTTLILSSSKALGGLLSNLNQRAIPMYWDIAQMLSKLSQLQKGILTPRRGGPHGGPPGGPLGFPRFAKAPTSIQVSSDIVKIAKMTLISYFLFSFLYGECRVKERSELTKSEINVRGGMLESLQNIEVVQSSDAGGREIGKFNSLYSDYEGRQAKVQTSLAIMNIVQGFILRAGHLASTLLVADRIFKGQNSVGALQAIQHLFDGLIHPLNFVGTMYREFKSNFKDVQSGLRLLKIKQIQDSPNAQDLRINRGSIQLRDLTFQYPAGSLMGDFGAGGSSGAGGSPASGAGSVSEAASATKASSASDSAALKNLNLSIAGKSTIAIVGPSGSGKSTLLRLLLRFYEPTIGQIGICGQPISQVTLKSLRKAISLVSQETLLFNTTLKENLLYGCSGENGPLPSEEEFEQAIIDTGLLDVVRKIGLDGRVGERGQALSGGERQRVAIARAMLKKSPIVLLDEPTSGLDALNEQLVMKAIGNLKGKSTVLIVAHKLSTIKDADEIIFLDSGILRERGTHQQLLTRNGQYAKLWDAQAAALGEEFEANNPEARRKREDSITTASTCSEGGGSGCCHDS